MVDPGTIATGIGLGKNALEFFGFLKKIGNTAVISAYFNHLGERKEGNDRIEIELHKSNGDEFVWWYSIKSVDGYVFTRFPVVETGLYEILGCENGEANPDSKFWRYVSEPLRGRIYGGGEVPNVKVDFVVMGYKPRAVIKHLAG